MRAVVLLLASGTCALLWWWLAGVGVPGAPTGSPGAAGPPAPARSTEEQERPAVERAAVEARPQISGPAPVPGNARWIDLTVFDRDTREPVANAHVHWLCDTFARRQQMTLAQRRRHDADPTAVVLEHGWSTRTDAAGHARIFGHRDEVFVVGRTRATFAGRRLTDDERDLGAATLELGRDRTVRARVLTSAGAPAAGVGVRLTYLRSRQDREGARASALRETDAQGIATFAHAQQRPLGRRKNRPVWSFAVANAGIDAPSVEIDEGALPPEPIELRLPASGHLRIRPLVRGEPVRLQAQNLMQGEASLWDPDLPRRPRALRWREADEEGWIEFRDVALGKQFAFGSSTWRAPVDGPQRTGETVEHEVELTEHTCVVRARVMDPEGAPVDRSRVPFTLTTDGRRQTLYPTTDQQGRVLAIYGSAVSEIFANSSSVAVRWHPAGGALAQTFLPTPAPDRGLVDFGSIHLRSVPVLVAGHIEHDAGAWHPTMLMVERFDAHAAAAGRDAWPIDHAIEVRQDVTRSAARRGFSAYGHASPGRYRLRIESPDYLRCEPVSFVPGATDLRVVLQSGARLQVHLRTPASLEQTQVPLRMRRTGAREPSEWRTPDQQDSGKLRCRWSALQPGTDALEALVASSSQVLQLAEGIDLSTSGAREQLEVDLRPLVRELVLDLRLAHGTTATDAVLFADPPARDAPDPTWRGVEIPLGRRTIAVPASARSFTVAARGCHPETFAATQDEVSVVLRPRPVATLEVRGLDRLPAGTRTGLVVDVAWPGEPDERQYAIGWSEQSLYELLEGVEPATRGDNPLQLPIGRHPLLVEKLLVFAGEGKTLPVETFTPLRIDAPGRRVVDVPPPEVDRLLRILDEDGKD